MIDENEFSEHESESATWIALADLMTGLMAIFLVMCMMIMTNQDRTRILIIQSVEKAMKEQGIKVKVDPKTGDISIAESILFPYGSAQLSPQGKYFLNEFIPVYSKVLFNELNPEQLEQVSRIVVEGHGSRDHNTRSDYATNMTLSLNRANAVVQYVNNMSPFSAKLPFLQKLTPVGRGNIDAKPYDDASDRKVVFKFQFASELFNTTKEELLEKRNISKVITHDGLFINQGDTPRKGEMKFFRSPAGSVFCGFFTPVTGAMSNVRCYSDEQGGIKYSYPPDGCVKHIAFTLWEEKKTLVRCDIQDVFEKRIFAERNNKHNILPDGKSIKLNGIHCLSQNTGITCTNKDGHHFSVSRVKQVTS